jgi:hypothetical protein
MKVKKLNKKQKEIFNNVINSLNSEFTVLKQYRSEKNLKMVTHCQRSIQDKISGIQNYLIYSDLKNYKALSNKLNNLKNCKELNVLRAIKTCI